MRRVTVTRLIVMATMLCGIWAAYPVRAADLDFNRDVRPILSQNCFKCHGPDDKQRKGALRLDKRAGALQALAGGRHAVAPGHPEQSSLIRRIDSTGADIMPPIYTNKTLTAAQKQTLRRWIAGGAAYSPHWAFVAPRQAPLPVVRYTGWARNAIDRFVLARLERAGLKPSPEADRYTLARRLYLDLIGLPPTPAQADAFVHDPRPDAYERVVDSLLASPHFGERWARRWLDLARYSDTNGFEKDRPRSVWLYRDWVINAFNRDLPFDRFTVEQLAGDMLPDAKIEQKIATGFHRNTMLNEEGGIDPLEYRFYSMVDRVSTTGTTWLGLTVGCAQCHTHKFDPITQREYYRLMACLDNADEPTLDVPLPDLAARRKQLEDEIARRMLDLPNRFPVESRYTWRPAKLGGVVCRSGAKATIQTDGSVLISGGIPETDTYDVMLDASNTDFDAVRLEALPDPSLGGNGPGRTPHGNFVLSRITLASRDGSAASFPRFVSARADHSQEGFPVSAALDAAGGRGWAVDGPGQLGVAHTAEFTLDRPVRANTKAWIIRLEQSFGGKHTLGRFRISLGRSEPQEDARPLEARRKELLERRFAQWVSLQTPHAAHWRTLIPARAAANLPLLTVLNDGSVFASGDMSKRDVYDLAFDGAAGPVAAIRLEALPDDRLPKHGPGRVFYEGGFGDFFLSEFNVAQGGKPVRIAGVMQNGGSDAAAAIDGDPQTGWSVNGRQGMTTTAVFRLAQPLAPGAFSLQMIFERYYAAGLGRFRISVTSDAVAASSELDPDAEAALCVPDAQRTEAQRQTLFRAFLQAAPELAGERAGIAALRAQLPEYPTALVFEERPANNPRKTFVHHRGEYLQPEERVTPGTLEVLPSPPNGTKLDRLEFARWLVSDTNPLTPRVVINRYWAALFGRGIVRTTEDFGYQGDLPTNPELLDWLAVEFRRQGWSTKRILRLIVTSATYRQSSRVTPQLMAADPGDLLMSRAPRVRLDAELLRDAALSASGLLSEKIGGPSVFPPQPPGVTSDGTYGPLAWNVSQGEDRYRRGLYTFSKRTAPYAMFVTFDGPTGESCISRRETSNTPLQALTLLNDQVFVEAAQALGRITAALPGADSTRCVALFRRCLTRPPTQDETAMLLQFYTAQKDRCDRREIDAAAIAGGGVNSDINSLAAWTLTARTLLNLDEAVTRR